MLKSDKERVVAELTERLRTSETLIVADYRGLTNAEIDGLRSKLLEHGARFAVVKNTLTRRAAEAAGADALLALLEGPSAIAFVESDGDPVAVAKALRDAAASTKVLAIRGGLLEGKSLTAEEIDTPREAAARRRHSRPARRGDRFAAHGRRSVAGCAAARPRRTDRRPHRTVAGAGRHVRGRRARRRSGSGRRAKFPAEEARRGACRRGRARGRGERRRGTRRVRRERRDH